MVKVIGVLCDHCQSPCRLAPGEGVISCVWCGEDVSEACERRYVPNDQCEHCAKLVGQDVCYECRKGEGLAEPEKRHVVEKLTEDKMRDREILVGPWITESDLHREAIDFADSLKDKGYDSLCGIPRSGLLVANIMSIRMGLPLYLASDLGPVYAGGGLRVRRRQETPENPRRMLLVEDSTASGHSFREIEGKWGEETLRAVGAVRAAVYATPDQVPHLAEFHRELPLPHWFAWNLLWNPFVMDAWKVGVDFDGVLCPDFEWSQDDDGWRYLAAMKSRRCLVPRGCHFHAIITARLEKYRPQTSDWLERFGITTDNLVMGPWRNNQERAGACIGSWKADHCDRLGVGMFVESDGDQARVISARRPQPVLCPALGGSIAQ